jgi:hypothetical protein
LAQAGRVEEARRSLDDFSRDYPKERAAIERSWTVIISAAPAQHN